MLKRPGKKRKSNRKKREPFLRRAGRFVKRLFLAVFIIGALGFTGYSALWLYRAALKTPYLTLRTVNVTGNERVTAEEVITLSGVHEGKNIFSFSIAEAKKGVKKNPWVDEVRLKRRLPDTLSFEIKERRPVAIVKMDRLYVMDSHGIIFKKLSPGDAVDLPVVTGLDDSASGPGEGDYVAGLMRLISLLEQRKGFNADNISEINVDPLYGFTLSTLDEGVRLRLGTTGFEERLKRFERILELRKGSLRGIRSMDLDSDREVVVRFNSEVSKGRGGI
ncbi:MAG: FtsQ-type POTRA domain-containing protein [Thermodesulfobacteriota bacterium]|nr:MAG: FtsQ-type POTRA domain-containing protein [Thermodesulfobacteriota bacterium]